MINSLLSRYGIYLIQSLDQKSFSASYPPSSRSYHPSQLFLYHVLAFIVPCFRFCDFLFQYSYFYIFKLPPTLKGKDGLSWNNLFFIYFRWVFLTLLFCKKKIPRRFCSQKTYYQIQICGENHNTIKQTGSLN